MDSRNGAPLSAYNGVMAEDLKMTKRIGVNPQDRERIEAYNAHARTLGLETPDLIVDGAVPVGQILLIPDAEPIPKPTIDDIRQLLFASPRGVVYPVTG